MPSRRCTHSTAEPGIAPYATTPARPSVCTCCCNLHRQQWAGAQSRAGQGVARWQGGGGKGERQRPGAMAASLHSSWQQTTRAWLGSRSPQSPALGVLLLVQRPQRPRCLACRCPPPQTRPARCQPAGGWECFGECDVHVRSSNMQGRGRPGTWPPAPPVLSHSGLAGDGEARRWQRRWGWGVHTAAPHPAALFPAASWMSGKVGSRERKTPPWRCYEFGPSKCSPLQGCCCEI